MKSVIHIAAVVMLTVWAGTLLQHLDHMVRHADLAITAAQSKVDATADNLNGAISQVKQAAANIKDVTDAEKENSIKTIEETQKTARALRQLIDRTDRQLNSGLLPAATGLVGHADRSVSDLDRGVLSTLAYAATTLSSADRQLNSPDVSGTLHNLQLSTASMAASMKDIQTRVHQVTKPRKWYTRAAWGALDVVSKLGALLGGL